MARPPSPYPRPGGVPRRVLTAVAPPAPAVASAPPAGAGLVRTAAQPVLPGRRTPTPLVLGRFRIVAVALLGLSTVFGVGAVVQRDDEIAQAAAATAQVERLNAVDAALTAAALGQDLTSPATAEAFNNRMITVYDALLDAAASGLDDIDSLKRVFAATTDFDKSVNAVLAQAQASQDETAAEAAYQTTTASLESNAKQPLAALIDEVRARAEAGPTAFRVLGLLLATLSAAAVLVVSVIGARRSHRLVNPWWVGSFLLHGGLIVQLATLGSAAGPTAVRLVGVVVTAAVALGFSLAGFRARLVEYR